MSNRSLLFGIAAIVVSFGLLSCDGVPVGEPGNSNLPAPGLASEAGPYPSATSADNEVVDSRASERLVGTGSRATFEEEALAESRTAASDRATKLRSFVPDGLYILAWQTEQREGMSVTMTASSAKGSPQVPGARHEIEISTRNGEISGCVLSKEGRKREPTPANCQMSNGKLVIIIKDEAGSGNAMELRMAPNRNGDYAGTITLISALLPGGKIEIGKASMTKIG